MEVTWVINQEHSQIIMRIKRENTFGLVIDIQERLFPVMYEKENLLKNNLILIKGLNTLEIPIIVTQQYTKGLGGTIKNIKFEIKDFKPVEKKDFSCCDEAFFIEKIKELKATNIIICGIESHVCVLQTAVDLKEAGLNPIVVLDCISSRKEKDLLFAIERFRIEGIMMASYESILFELTRSANSSEFKSISKLVK